MRRLITILLLFNVLLLDGQVKIYDSPVDSLTVESYINEIYVLIFKKYIWGLQQPSLRNEKATVVIREKPKYFSEVEDGMVERISIKYKKVQDETFEAFKKKINDPVNFENINIPGFNIYVFEDESFPSWSDLEENYMNWNRKFIEFTPIGFNDDLTQAMLYFGYDDRSIGGGGFLILERKRKRWKLKSYIGIWAA